MRQILNGRIFALLCVGIILGGCAVQEDLHYQVAPSVENPRDIKLGGMVSDQLVALWEENDRDAAATLELLRAMTDDLPIVIDNPLVMDKALQELWVEAIQHSNRGSFHSALRAASLRISDRALCIRLVGPVSNRRVGYWRWCPRDFLGETLKHVDQIENEMPRIVIANDRSKFVFADTNETFVPYGLDGSPTERFEPTPSTDWERLENDFVEMKSLGTNLVRVHLQFGNYMDAWNRPNQEALSSLRRFLRLAEREGLYVDVTGLACYQAELIPRWYDRLSERRRWDAQANFWAAIARTCATSNAVFCYDLMNEPVMDGGVDSVDSPWLIGEAFGGKYYFVQRIIRDLRGRDPFEVRKAWVDKLTAAIRKHDPDTLITVGAIPFVISFGGGQPAFYANNVDENLDFVSVHVYPRSKHVDPVEMDLLIERLGVYDIGKPVLIEETSSFRTSNEVWGEFLDRSTTIADGWVSQYFGTCEELEANGDLGSLIQKAIFEFWLSKQWELTAAAM